MLRKLISAAKPLNLLLVTFLAASCTQGSNSDNEQSDPLISKVSSLLQLRKVDEATSLASEAVAKSPKSTKALYASAMVAVAKLDNESALQTINKALDIDGRDSALYSERSQIEYRLGDLSSALADANSAISFDEKNALAYHRRALIEIQGQDYDAALQDLDLAAKLDPKRSQYYIFVNKGRAYVGLRRYKDAVEQFSLSIPLAPPKNEDGLLGRAMCAGKLGEAKDCLADSRKALSEDPKNGLALALSAGALSLLGKHSEAVEIFQNNLERCTGKLVMASADVGGNSMSDLATACINKGQSQRAIELLHRIGAERPLEVEEQMILARAYAATKRLDKASALLSDCLATEPARADIRAQLSRIYAQRGMSSLAAEVERDGRAPIKKHSG